MCLEYGPVPKAEGITHSILETKGTVFPIRTYQDREITFLSVCLKDVVGFKIVVLFIFSLNICHFGKLFI